MEKFMRFCNRKAFQLHDSSAAHPLDPILMNPSQGKKYMIDELAVGVILSLLIAAFSAHFMGRNWNLAWATDPVLAAWLLIIVIIKIVDM